MGEAIPAVRAGNLPRVAHLLPDFCLAFPGEDLGLGRIVRRSLHDLLRSRHTVITEHSERVRDYVRI